MRAGFVLLVMAAAAVFLLRRVGVGRSILNIERTDVHFPTVSGNNLMRHAFTFPRDFVGELNVVFVPFLQEQQLEVNTWIPFARELEATYPNVAHYEFPTVWQMSAMRRTALNEGMRAGIPDPIARERTITLYIDLADFMDATGIDGRNQMHTLLVNRNGDILWRTTGRMDDEKAQALTAAIEAVR